MKARLNVTFFKNGLDPIDGSGEHLTNYACQLRQAGHSVSVLLANPIRAHNQYARRLRAAAVPVAYLGHTPGVLQLRLRRLLSKLPTRSPARRGAPWLLVLEAGLARFLRARPPHVLHVFVDPAAPFALRAAAQAETPALCHELISPRPFPATDAYYDELATILAQTGALAAQSATLAEECRTRIPYRGRIAVIPNIVADPARAGSRTRPDTSDGAVVVGFASRFEPRKAPLLLIEAFAEALREEPRLRLKLAGDGPLRNDAVAHAGRLGVSGQCDFVGSYSTESARHAFFAAVDVIVQPSLAEGVPNTVIEGMAHGKAIVCSAVGGLTDVLSSASALLVPPGDGMALSSALASVAANAGLRQTLGLGARRVYETTFSPAAVLPVLLSEYERLLALYRPR